MVAMVTLAIRSSKKEMRCFNNIFTATISSEVGVVIIFFIDGIFFKANKFIADEQGLWG